MTEWRSVKGFEGWYEVSDDGQVRSVTRIIEHATDKTWGISKIQQNEGKLLTPQENNKGYLYLQLYRNSKHTKRYVHRMVAEAFLPNDKPSYRVVNHINGNPKDNRVENLEWCTQKYNIQQAFETGLTKTRIPVRATNVRTGEVLEFEGVTVAARAVGCSHSGISLCLTGKNKLCKGYRWEYIGKCND